MTLNGEYMGNIMLTVIIILVVVSAAIFIFGGRKRRSHRRYQYIPPCSLKGWSYFKHPPKWVRVRTVDAPIYEPQQGNWH
jgi:hypothetical protein